MAPRLKEHYEKNITPSLMKELGIANVMEVPKVTKISINAGVGKIAVRDKKLVDNIAHNIAAITGQHPQTTYSRKSIAGFKLRQGMPVGLVVTLHGNRMYEFLDRLVSVTLPRVRDFRGLNAHSFDKDGNYSIGIREHVVFAELPPESSEFSHGLQVNISIAHSNKERSYTLLKHMGFPLQEKASTSGNKKKKKTRK